MQDSSSRPASPCHAPSHTTLSADRDPNYLRKHKRAYVVCVCLCVCVPVCAAIASVFKFCAAASRLSACLPPPFPSLPAPLPYFILCKSAFACAQIFEVNACKTLKLVNFLSCIRNAANFCSLPACLPSPFTSPPPLLSSSTAFHCLPLAAYKCI